MSTSIIVAIFFIIGVFLIGMGLSVYIKNRPGFVFTNKTTNFRVTSRLPLTAKTSLLRVRDGDREFLIAVGNEQVSVVDIYGDHKGDLTITSGEEFDKAI